MLAHPSVQSDRPAVSFTPNPTAVIFTFVDMWRNACRAAFRTAAGHSLFRCHDPWNSSRAVERTRWHAFCRLVDFLNQHHIPHDQFCTAVTQHHARYVKRLPNPRQVKGDWGLKIWDNWVQNRKKEDNGGERRVAAAAILGSQSYSNTLLANIRQAYSDCEQFGPADAPSRLWGPEILWLFWHSEPKTLPGIKKVLLAVEDKDAWRSAFAVINASEQKRALLRSLRHRVTNTPLPILK